MDTTQTSYEESTVYDLNEISKTSDRHATSIVRLALRETVIPLFEENPNLFPFIDMCIGELVQDVERHGDGQKKVMLVGEMRGITIETENGIKEHDATITGLGGLALERVFKQNYSAVAKDGIFRTRIFIPRDPIEQEALDYRLTG